MNEHLESPRLVVMEQSIMLDIERLKAAALAASSGPWKTYKDGKPELRNQEYVVESECRMIAYGQLRDEDAAYIAAANPEAVLELIAEIERLRKYESVNNVVDREKLATALRRAILPMAHASLGNPLYEKAYEELNMVVDSIYDAEQKEAANTTKVMPIPDWSE